MYIPSRASGSEFDVVIALMASMPACFGMRSSSGVVGSDPYKPNSRSYPFAHSRLSTNDQ